MEYMYTCVERMMIMRFMCLNKRKWIEKTVLHFILKSNVYLIFFLSHIKMCFCSSPVFSGVRVTRSLVFCPVFCRLLFVLLYFFFWSLCCLSFFLRILITPLVSSNSSNYLRFLSSIRNGDIKVKNLPTWAKKKSKKSKKVHFNTKT